MPLVLIHKNVAILETAARQPMEADVHTLVSYFLVWGALFFHNNVLFSNPPPTVHQSTMSTITLNATTNFNEIPLAIETQKIMDVIPKDLQLPLLAVVCLS